MRQFGLYHSVCVVIVTIDEIVPNKYGEHPNISRLGTMNTKMVTYRLLKRWY